MSVVDQVERLEVVETGRRRRWSDDEKLRIVLGI
jgi:transposase